MQCSTFHRQIHPSQAGQSLRVGLPILIAQTARPERAVPLAELWHATPIRRNALASGSRRAHEPDASEFRLMTSRAFGETFGPARWLGQETGHNTSKRKGSDRHVVGLVVERVAGSFAPETSPSGEWGVADASGGGIIARKLTC